MEVFISARRSVLVEHERKLHKARKLGVKDKDEVDRVDLHPSLVGDLQENFQTMSDD